MSDPLSLSDADGADLIRILSPDRPETVWEWATKRLVLPNSESSSQGGFDQDRASLFRRFSDVIAARRQRRQISTTDPYADRCERLWGVTSAQLGKTVWLFIAGSWQAVHYPHLPIGFVWPRQELRKSQLRGRLEPLWQATPSLAAIMPTPGSEDYAQRISDRMWRLGNGNRVRMLTGSIANELRANPLASIYMDEYDACPADVGGQGNPLRLVEDRGRTWGADFLIVGVTTPTVIDHHGWRTLCQGTHERLMMTCSACQGIDWLNPEQVTATEDADPIAVRREDMAAWSCRWCGVMHRTDAVRAMRDAAVAADAWCPGIWEITEDVPRGTWTPSADIDGNGRIVGRMPFPDAETRSFHLNILYGRDWTLGRFLSEQMNALAGSLDDQRAFWNTARAEPWLPQGLADITSDDRAAIVSTYKRGVVPNAATRLVLMLDQQANTSALVWFPWVLRAVGEKGETWLIDAGKVPAMQDDSTGGGWMGVDRLEGRTWRREDGQEMRVSLSVMDGANGNLASRVRQWAAGNSARRQLVWGNAKLRLDEPFRAYAPGARAKVPWPHGVRGWELNSNFWRDRIDERRRCTPGAPKWWLPDDAPSFYLRSLWDSEVRVVVQRQVTGVGMREITAWEPAKQADSHGQIAFRRDNHWFDAEVAIAAIIAIHGWDDSGVSRVRKMPPRKYGIIGKVFG